VARIALVCEPPDGGVAEHVAQLAKGLPEHGHEPVVFDSRRLPFVREYTRPDLDARALATLARALDGFDLVHAHAAKAGVIGRLAARARGLPAVYTPHCFPFVGEVSTARKRFSVVVERALAPLTAALICVCEDERQVAIAHRVRPQRLAVVHNGSPPCEAPAPARGERPPTVGAVAALRRQKRIDVLLAAAPRILDAGAVVKVIGDGPEAPALRAQADPRVIFEPFTPPSARHLRELDVYVLPSSWEAFPIGVLEAMACGVPQVATDVGGTREALTPVLVAPNDPDALADAILALLADDERRAELAARSRAVHAERFTVERMVAGTAAVYDQVLSTRRGRR
jgi:glycosyltransferase involved in cell wall biosynthesis